MNAAPSGCRYRGVTSRAGPRGSELRSAVVAVVITVTGRLDETTVQDVVGQLCRFVRLDDPVVLDVGDLDIADGGILERLVSAFDAECHWGGVDWVLVAASADRPSIRADDEDELRHLLVLLNRAVPTD